MAEQFDPALIDEMGKEELAELYRRVLAEIEDLESIKTVSRRRLYDNMEMDGEVIGDYQLSKYELVYFGGTSMEEAKELGAVKTVEKKDTKKLRSLYKKGVDIPGAKVVPMVKIQEIEEEGGNDE